VSCFTAVVRLGARPVLAEIDETFCLAPGEIARLRTPRTKAALVVHYQGAAADLQPILAEARSAGLQVLEDCAESAGVSYRGKRIGTIGDIGIFSFQYQKTMTSGEGGMVTTDDPVLYERAVRMHDIGLFRPYHKQFVAPAEPAFCGSQFRMAELTAAVALAQLRKLDRVRAHCRRLQARVLARIGSLPGLEFRRIPDPSGDTGLETYFSPGDAATAAKFREKLDDGNVNCGKTTGTYCHYAGEYCRQQNTHAPGAAPFARFPHWPAPGYRAEDFPNTEALVHRFIAIPLGVLYTDEDADYIGAVIARAHQELLG
jgi:8-amino-3,8-dideoxy-alpha-D-manno-octulosonate transaminase